ncbi:MULTISPECIES: ribosome biogenesis GTP-binding protein YihA/YsxC [Shouchella]|uniref:Probable GTP-binding protein EngB n=3 Tax=Bacillaceae TaxID=186817 RepID=A0A060LZJ2_9BACI|nr:MULTISPECIES: ribosome biogenesis GTP-binding protein YihA/YsxC [Bacillaceae]RQW21007.1 YihA family ribosome biogenesis GTP-binding protein [Bacillus sp. C1-1]AIC95190.1 ribosome biogenesis GTP-binding protein [Shouchella lehensis G1]KQL57573.1 GTP-binding protein [Alkalicoccobacillus plakortidis]MBG9783996.1 GTP-binding protein [Shouchella lehensis]TES51031.1 YihA family ribosome biogenesis GTP-binding protein [Shouchella lehensis]
MKVVKAELEHVAVKPEQYPVNRLPELALAGRSNVGKSSFINKMLNRKGLARTSGQPGKTQTLNFYEINEILYFVDVPGYGYAKVSKTERAAWGKMIETYLSEREELKAVLQLIDARHKPSEDDKLMYNWMKHFGIPVILVATKADKISRSKWQKHLSIISKELDREETDPLLLFSSETGYGKEEAWKTIQSHLQLTKNK